MEVNITARNLSVSDRFREYVADRTHKVEQFAHKAQSIEVKVTRHDHSRTAGSQDQVELTVIEPGHVVRAEATADDKFSAFDIALAKLSERLRRAADRRKVHHGRHGLVGTSELTASDFAQLDVRPVDGMAPAPDTHTTAPSWQAGINNSGCCALQVLWRAYGREVVKAGVFKLMWSILVILGGMPC